MCGMVGMTRTGLPITCHHVVLVTIASISMNGRSSLSEDAHLIPVIGPTTPNHSQVHRLCVPSNTGTVFSNGFLSHGPCDQPLGIVGVQD